MNEDSAHSTHETPVSGQRWFDPDATLNHLAGETSPYLLSHADNPVDWYPWGEEALTRAREQNKPIFLSIGYAACHWCHVMEHEVFEDEAVAEFLNRHFVSIKVDREERPDLDRIYMQAVQIFTRGGGGWPMTVFMTPELKPFFAATYLPRDSDPASGRPGFLTLASRIEKMYSESNPKLFDQANAITDALREQLKPFTEAAELSAEKFSRAIESSLGRVDFSYGGFGEEQKFPHHSELTALLRDFALNQTPRTREALDKTLRAMLSKGMYDHVGGGFHRYTVDRRWAVPHFEKMLYDNALLASVYADAFLLFGERDYRDALTGVLDFMLAELADPSGGFYSAIDADSEGEEGAFYVWLKKELDNLLGDDADFYYSYYRVSEFGNFDGGANVLARIDSAWSALRGASEEAQIRDRLSALNRKLYIARQQRERPLTDDKIITAWNGMALTALARGFQVTGERRYGDAAQRLGALVRDTLYQDGALAHVYRRGSFSDGQFLEDYGYIANGLVDLYESDGDVQWLTLAAALAHEAFELFADSTGFLYLTVESAQDHLIRPNDIFDGSYPAAGSYLLQAAQRISALTDDKPLRENLNKSLAALSGAIDRAPLGLFSALLVAHNQFIPRAEFAVVGPVEEREPFLQNVYRRYFPNRIIAFGDGADGRVALLKNREPLQTSQATGFVCRDYVCQLPTSDPEEFREQIDAFNISE
ncbi:MAG TPA: thioredoxin domain-containing protein [candidate division Zixibacteria bacterium]|nr:thioredoxin domain-containing protein [candidate division Zixibacteria bacterium]